MPRSSTFKFKQFTIEQDRCAMKVTSDACLFGAYISVPSKGKILDIGAGTGLLSLMLAQRTSEQIIIDAVEIDQKAGMQANENINKSPWSKRIHLHICPIQEFVPSPQDAYEIIVCNPPFHNQSFKSRNKDKRSAWHTTHLDHRELVISVYRLLSASGRFHLLLPCSEEEAFVSLCHEHGLFKQVSCYLHPYTEKSPNRVFLQFGKVPSEPFEDCLIIYDHHQAYSRECTELLKPYFTTL